MDGDSGISRQNKKKKDKYVFTFSLVGKFQKKKSTDLLSRDEEKDSSEIEERVVNRLIQDPNWVTGY